jgi:PAS domain S-box-containing protein
LLAIFAGGAAFLSAQWNAAVESRALIDRSHRIIETSLTMVKEMVDAETGQRGFVVTGDESYLAPFHAAEASVPDRFQQLRQLGIENAAELKEVERIESLWGQRMARLKEGIGKARSGDFAGARSVIAEGSGRRLMDEIRTEADRLQSAERTLLTERLAASDRSRDRLGLTIAIALSMAGIGLAASVIALTRKAERLVSDVQSQRQIARNLEEATFELADEVTTVRAELSDTARRFNAALRTAPIVIASQDRELRYLWMRNSLLGQPADWFIGRRDDEVMPEPARARMIALKRESLEAGEPRDFEVHLAGEGDADGRWYDVHVEPTRNDHGVIDSLTMVAIDVTERKRRERHVRFLMRELAHRSKNALAVTLAMARQTAASASTTEEFMERFTDRLEALARANSLLASEAAAGATIEDLVRSQLGHYVELVDRQVFLSGPPLTLPGEVLQTIGLALHELATNAGKYGALSTPDGRVDIAWGVVPRSGGGALVTLGWRESGGPAVTPPERRGFGRIVIERMAARTLGGEVELDYRPEGLVWSLRFITGDEEAEDRAAHSAATA